MFNKSVEKQEVSIGKFVWSFIISQIAFGIVFEMLIVGINMVLGNLSTYLSVILLPVLLYLYIIMVVKDVTRRYTLTEENFIKAKKILLIIYVVSEILLLSPEILSTLSGRESIFELVVSTIANIVNITIFSYLYWVNLDIEYYNKDRTDRMYIMKVIILFIIAIVVSFGEKFLSTKIEATEYKRKISETNTLNSIGFDYSSADDENDEIENNDNIPVDISSYKLSGCEIPSEQVKTFKTNVISSVKTDDNNVDAKFCTVAVQVDSDTNEDIKEVANVSDGLLENSISDTYSYLKKYDYNKNLVWQLKSDTSYRFEDFKEVTDGYIIYAYVNGKDLIIKISKDGKMVKNTYLSDNVGFYGFAKLDNKATEQCEMLLTDKDSNINILQCDLNLNVVADLNLKISSKAIGEVYKKGNEYVGCFRGTDSSTNIDKIFLYNSETKDTKQFDLNNDSQFTTQLNTDTNKIERISNIITDENGSKIYFTATLKDKSDLIDVYEYDINANKIIKYGYTENTKLQGLADIEGASSITTKYRTLYLENDNVYVISYNYVKCSNDSEQDVVMIDTISNSHKLTSRNYIKNVNLDFGSIKSVDGFVNDGVFYANKVFTQGGVCLYKYAFGLNK